MLFFIVAYGAPGVPCRADGQAMEEQESGFDRNQREERDVVAHDVAELAHSVPNAMAVEGSAGISLGIISEIAIKENFAKDFFGFGGESGIVEGHLVGGHTEMVDGDAGKEFPTCGEAEATEIMLELRKIDGAIMGV